MQSPRFERIFVIPPAFMPRGMYKCRGMYFSSFRSSVRSFVSSLFSVTFVEFTPKFMAKVSLSEYIFLTNQ